MLRAWGHQLFDYLVKMERRKNKYADRLVYWHIIWFRGLYEQTLIITNNQCRV